MWPKLQTTIFLFLAICAFRIANTFLIQSFFDPDEYWQTLEPAYCEVFLKSSVSTDDASSALNLECAGYTWEWKRRAPVPSTTTTTTTTTTQNWMQQCFEGPIRSYLSVLPTHWFYSLLIKHKWDTHFLVSQGPKILTAVIAAAPTDLAVWIMAHWLPQVVGTDNNNQSQSTKRQKQGNYGSESLPWFCLFCTMCSWFHGYALVRTFSNSLETMLLTTAMALIAPELLGNIKSGVSSSSSSSSSTLRHCVCFLLGGCSVAMRFSSVTAWVPMGILFANQRHPPNGSWMTWLGFLIRTCAVFGVLGIFLACTVDRYFYGFWTIPFLGSFHFNVILGNSLLYGEHPWHWYFTAGMPAVTGLWLPLVMWDFWLSVARKDETTGARRNLWIIIMTYTVAHSQSGHKEFRFLMPILPLLCLLAGPHLRTLLLHCSRKQGTPSRVSQPTDVLPWLILLAIPNLIALLYLGLFHQSAPISVNHRIASIVQKQEHQPRQIPGSSTTQPHAYSVHYLTGACHSTPLHSYLHVPAQQQQQQQQQQQEGGSIPSIRFNIWSLDCSPDCRANPNELCESEKFAKDPVGFVQAAYFRNPVCIDEGNEEKVVDDSGAEEQQQSCSAADDQQHFRLPPQFLVTYADYAIRLRPQLLDLGLEEVGRFSHGINGLRIGTTKSGDGYSQDLPDDVFRRVKVLGDLVELSIDEMVLYSDMKI